MTKLLHKQVKDRLQFVLIFVLFFPTVLQALFELYSDASAGASKPILSWGVSICALILIYLFLEGTRHANERLLKAVDFFLKVELFLFVPVLGLLGILGTEGELHIFASYILLISLCLLAIIPVAVLVPILILWIEEKSLWISQQGSSYVKTLLK